MVIQQHKVQITFDIEICLSILFLLDDNEQNIDRTLSYSTGNTTVDRGRGSGVRGENQTEYTGIQDRSPSLLSSI
jgi:hypothetical protein